MQFKFHSLISRIKSVLGLRKPGFKDRASHAGFSVVEVLDESSGTRYLEIGFLAWPCKMYLRENSSDVASFRKIFLDHEYALNLNNSPDFIIDAGANTGLSSVYFAQRFPSATIISLEPEPHNFQLLIRNTQSYPNIHPIQSALWYEATPLNIIDFGKHDNFQVVIDILLQNDIEIKSKLERYNGKVLLRCIAITISDLVERFNISRIGLLKMDIEGSEREVFIHSSPWIGKVDAIVAELHEKWHPGCDQAFHDHTISFDQRWERGENHFVSRGSSMTPKQ